jgi:ABC-type sugar transport system substrate-binding protein
MRRVIVALVAAATVGAGVAACGDDEGGGAAGASTSKGAVAMSFGGSTIALWNDEINLMRPMIEKAGYKFLVDDPQFKVQKQVQDWQAWIAQGEVKAIMGWPIQVDALIPVTKQATAANIPVLGYAVAWDGVKASLLTKPEEDGGRMADEAVAWIKKTYGDKPVEVAVLSDEANDLTRLRVDGIYNGVKAGAPNAQVVKVPALTLEDGYNAAKRQLTAHPDTKVWLSYSNDNLKGVYKALMDAHVKKDDPNYLLAGMDVTNQDLNLIQVPNSIYRLAFAFRSTVLAKVNADLLIKAASGQPVKDVYVSFEKVTADNAKQFYVGNGNK